jgi:hypothetical protein
MMPPLWSSWSEFLATDPEARVRFMAKMAKMMAKMITLRLKEIILIVF